MPRCHLFLLVLNNSGSSALTKVLGRCRRAVVFPRIRDLVPQATGEMADMVAEGQFLFGGQPPLGPQPGPLGVPRIFTERLAVFADPANYRWNEIRARWDDAWSRHPADSDPDAVRIEKSPTNALRSAMLEDVFEDARFLVMTRDPYAVTEGIRRRHGYKLERCVRHWIVGTRCLAEAVDARGSIATTSYEALCGGDQAGAADAIRGLVPELDDLDLRAAVTAHSIDGSVDRPLEDLNARQVARLSDEDRRRIGGVLEAEAGDLLERFGYAIRD